jgi:hypothetical protein
MRFLSALVIAASIIGAPAYAAKFQPSTVFKNTSVKKFAALGTKLSNDKTTFGDATVTFGASYTRKTSEKDINTVKQFVISNRVGDAGDYDGIDASGDTAEEIADYLFNNSGSLDFDESAEAKVKAATREIIAAIKVIKNDPTLQIYTAAHGDDDGSWSAVVVNDTKNKQILVVQLGFFGN